MSEIQLNDPQTLYRRWAGLPVEPLRRRPVDRREQWPELEPTLRDFIYYKDC